MTFVCEKEKLQEAINIVQKAAAVSSTIPVLMGILIKAQKEKIILSCNNLDIAIVCEIDAVVSDPGEVVVNSRLLGDIVKKIVGEKITVSILEKTVVQIKTESSCFDVVGMGTEEFPEIPSVQKEFSFVIQKKKLKEIIKGTIFAAGTSESKLILTGCLIDVEEHSVRCVAVDGFRLALRETATENKETGSFVVPSRSLNEFNKIIAENEDEISVSISKKNIIFEYEGVRFISRLLEGNYIDYKNFIPKDFQTMVRADAAELEAAVERASLMITNESNKSPIIIKIESGKMEISCETQMGKAIEKLSPEIEGDSLRIGFNHKYLLDAIRACPSENFMMGFGNNIAPCLMYPKNEDGGYKYMVLPLRIRENG